MDYGRRASAGVRHRLAGVLALEDTVVLKSRARLIPVTGMVAARVRACLSISPDSR